MRISELSNPYGATGARPTASEIVDRPWRMLTGGAATEAASGDTMDVINPADETVVTRIPLGGAADVDAAVEAALTAAPAWAATSVADRARVLVALAEAIEAHGEELAWTDTIDNGSPIGVMRGDFRAAVAQLRYFAGLALQLRGQTIPMADHDALDYTLRDPFGVVGRIVPWNHPLLFAAARIAAPLLAGNTVVLKPAEATSLSALRLGELAAGLVPPGVLNIVPGIGPDAGERLVTHPDVPRIAFTGSSTTGRRVQARAASAAVKTVTLELGGKNPLIVFADADVHAAVDGAVAGMNFTWQGQSCGSTSRLLVHSSLYEDVVTEVGRRMDAMRLGDPADPATDIGPLVSAEHYRKVTSYIRAGLSDPALRLVAGGSALHRPGYYVRPTLFSAPAGPTGPLFQEEIFGPVLVAAPFDSYDQAITEANALPYGLTASVWTTGLHTAMAAARDLRAGYVWVNASSAHVPGAAFGGVRNSGVGREEGMEELESYTQPKNVFVRF
ncbi:MULTISPECIES: aldehyde dehydrogenase family protein [unclassified Streptomyces]|uniref:aldehyde dehydrogenase family protein n=1 Tax=unclassified Streptomyces TaxID=2593676 RepID=UPI0003614778|nr:MULTISPECIES: aldehyde dehydrogenase family protein [unclassified Streptomyces]MYX39152.1 aldehyde dehydrogenase family protein [Streptomyces sp. SID8377]